MKAGHYARPQVKSRSLTPRQQLRPHTCKQKASLFKGPELYNHSIWPKLKSEVFSSCQASFKNQKQFAKKTEYLFSK